jgi:hypothetical protein
MIVNHSREENRERERTRLKFKIGSFFSKLFWTTISVHNVMRRKANPKTSPMNGEVIR